MEPTTASTREQRNGNARQDARGLTDPWAETGEAQEGALRGERVGAAARRAAGLSHATAGCEPSGSFCLSYFLALIRSIHIEVRGLGFFHPMIIEEHPDVLNWASATCTDRAIGSDCDGDGVGAANPKPPFLLVVGSPSPPRHPLRPAVPLPPSPTVPSAAMADGGGAGSNYASILQAIKTPLPWTGASQNTRTYIAWMRGGERRAGEQAWDHQRGGQAPCTLTSSSLLSLSVAVRVFAAAVVCSDCADFYFEVQLDLHARGLKKYIMAVRERRATERRSTGARSGAWHTWGGEAHFLTAAAAAV